MRRIIDRFQTRHNVMVVNNMACIHPTKEGMAEMESGIRM